jgi:hypothetical protein
MHTHVSAELQPARRLCPLVHVAAGA